MKQNNFVAPIAAQPNNYVQEPIARPSFYWLRKVVWPLVSISVWLDSWLRILTIRWAAGMPDTESADWFLSHYYGYAWRWVDDQEQGDVEEETSLFEPEEPQPTASAQTIALSTFKPVDKDVEAAFQSVATFTLACFKVGMVDSEGVLSKGIIAPWAKRGALPTVDKEHALGIIDSITPPLWSLHPNKKLWQLNLVNYRDADEAQAALNEVYYG